MRKSRVDRGLHKSNYFTRHRRFRPGKNSREKSDRRQWNYWRKCCANTAGESWPATTERRNAMSDKIKPHHLERTAILTIRQSSWSPWRKACGNWAGAGTKWWVIAWVGRLPGPSLAPALNAWWQKFVWARWAQWPRGRYRDSHGTAGSGNS